MIRYKNNLTFELQRSHQHGITTVRDDSLEAPKRGKADRPSRLVIEKWREAAGFLLSEMQLPTIDAVQKAAKIGDFNTAEPVYDTLITRMTKALPTAQPARPFTRPAMCQEYHPLLDDLTERELIELTKSRRIYATYAKLAKGYCAVITCSPRYVNKKWRFNHVRLAGARFISKEGTEEESALGKKIANFYEYPNEIVAVIDEDDWEFLGRVLYFAGQFKFCHYLNSQQERERDKEYARSKFTAKIIRESGHEQVRTRKMIAKFMYDVLNNLKKDLKGILPEKYSPSTDYDRLNKYIEYALVRCMYKMEFSNLSLKEQIDQIVKK